MKIVIIGSSGHWGYALHALPLVSEARIVGIAPGSTEENMDGVERSCVQAGTQPARFTDWRVMLDQTRPDIAVVNPWFGEAAAITMEALSRGIHVFAEKPLATTFADLDRLRQILAKNPGVKLTAMHNYRYHPAFYAAWCAVRDGRIGDVRLMTAQKSYRLGNRAAFYRKRDTYGGTIPWVGSHAIDWLLWFAGARPQRVYAAHSTRDNGGHGELELTALCHFTFPGEVLGGANIDYLRPTRATSHGDDRVRVAGTTGIVEVQRARATLMNGEQDGEQLLYDGGEPGTYGELMADFLREIDGTGSCRVTAEDALDVTEACLLARQAADENRIIDWRNASC